VTALSTRTGELAIAAIARMTLTVKNKALLSRLHQTLEQAGAVRGWSLGEAMELVVNDHGLDSEGRLRTTVGAYEAEVIVSADRTRLAFHRDGKPLSASPRSPPIHSGQTGARTASTTTGIEPVSANSCPRPRFAATPWQGCCPAPGSPTG